MAEEYCRLLEPEDRDQKAFKSLDYFASALGASGDGATLFVFDNFETVRSPGDLYKWLDTYVRSPNKILVTTRSRDFKGDYWVEVGGMTDEQFGALVDQTARELDVSELIDTGYKTELHQETDGHPYVAKVLLGEVARSGTRQNVKRLMASQERVLEALFERTFSHLAPATQRVFMTLCSWRSLVPVVALQAAVSRPANEKIDVEAAVDELKKSSLIELAEMERPFMEQFVAVPLAAAVFGKRKVTTSPMKSAIEADLEFLRLFGPVQPSGTSRGITPQVERLFASVAERVANRPSEADRYLPVLEFVSSEQPIGWVLLAQLYDELRLTDEWADRAADAYRRYLENVPNDARIWRKLAEVCTWGNDYLGAVHALVQRAELPEASYADVSYAATKINHYLREGDLAVDTTEKKVLVGALVTVMQRRVSEADATDHSRLAWLLLNTGQVSEARTVVRAGLELDPENQYCIRLKAKIGGAGKNYAA